VCVALYLLYETFICVRHTGGNCVSINIRFYKIEGVQLKSGPHFNMSNLFNKIYNILYYTTKPVFILSVGNDVHSFQCTYRHVSPCSSQLLVAFFHLLLRNSPFYWCLSSKFFKETLSTVGVRHRF